MTLIGFVLLIAVGFGVGYDVKTKECNKKGCVKVETTNKGEKHE